MFGDKDYDNFVERMGSFEDVLEISDDSELKHHGVLGMKWGVRRTLTPGVVGAAAKTGQSVTSLGQNINKSGTSRKALKKAKSLSDEELKQLASRLELENRYINAQAQQSGRNKVDAILSTAGGVLAVASSAAILVDQINKVRK